MKNANCKKKEKYIEPVEGNLALGVVPFEGGAITVVVVVVVGLT